MDPGRYAATVFWSDEDGGFIATAPELPGCSAWGDTRDKAVSELQDAICAWIEAAEHAGNPIPQPRKSNEFSGKFMVRLPRSLHAAVAYFADVDETSINQFVVATLAQRVGQAQAVTLLHAHSNQAYPLLRATSSALRRALSIQNITAIEGSSTNATKVVIEDAPWVQQTGLVRLPA